MKTEYECSFYDCEMDKMQREKCGKTDHCEETEQAFCT